MSLSYFKLRRGRGADMRIDRSRKGSIDNSVYYLIKGVTEIKYGLLLQMPSDQSRSSAVN